MMKSTLRISSFHSTHNVRFIQRLKALCKIHRISITQTGSNIRRQKNTILRSPHVHKTARDQIEVQHHISFLRLKPNYAWVQFISNLPDLNLGLEYRHAYGQRVYFLNTK